VGALPIGWRAQQSHGERLRPPPEASRPARWEPRGRRGPRAGSLSRTNGHRVRLQTAAAGDDTVSPHSSAGLSDASSLPVLGPACREPMFPPRIPTGHPSPAAVLAGPVLPRFVPVIRPSRNNAALPTLLGHDCHGGGSCPARTCGGRSWPDFCAVCGAMSPRRVCRASKLFADKPEPVRRVARAAPSAVNGSNGSPEGAPARAAG